MQRWEEIAALLFVRSFLQTARYQYFRSKWEQSRVKIAGLFLALFLRSLCNPELRHFGHSLITGGEGNRVLAG